LPWLALASYVILISAMVSAGRAQIGEHRAITPRYLNISQYLLVAMLALAAIAGPVLKSLWKKGAGADADTDNSRNHDAFLVAGVALLCVFVTAQIPVWQYGLKLTDAWYHARKQAQAVLLFLPFFKPGNLNVLDKDTRQWNCLENAVKPLLEIGKLKCKPLDSPELKHFSKQDKPLGKEKAAITSAKFREDGGLELTGNARFSVTQPTDAVLITMGDRVINLGQPQSRPLLRLYGLDFEFANVEDVPVASMYPWKAVIAPEYLPDGNVTLDFWALDVGSKNIAAMPVHLAVDRAAKKAVVE